MKIRVFSIVLIICCMLLSGCTGPDVIPGPKVEVTSYAEQVVEVNKPINLEITSDASNIEVYSWDNKKVKFEITRKIRGMEGKEKLQSKLENFKIDLKKEQEKILFSSKYKGPVKSLADRSVDLKVFVPKKVGSIYCNVDLGTIKFYDDLRCNFKADIKTVNIDINKIEGKVNLKGDMGNLTIHEGKIKAGSTAKVNFGNIIIKAAFEEGSNYDFETGVGNLEFKLPKESKVYFEGIGNVELNEFQDASYPTVVKLNSGMGRITVGKS